MSRFRKVGGFAVLSLAYAAFMILFLLMLALGDCPAHDEIPRGHCWADGIRFGHWVVITLGGYLLMILVYLRPFRRRTPGP